MKRLIKDDPRDVFKETSFASSRVFANIKFDLQIECSGSEEVNRINVEGSTLFKYILICDHRPQLIDK